MENRLDTSISEMLKKYPTETKEQRLNAIKEVLQEIILFALSRAGFFDKAAFYGGTALRIFYGLDRFSEDLDFSLIVPDPDFSFEPYFETIEKEMAGFGISVKAVEKKKSRESSVKSAFLKANTKEQVYLFFPTDQNISGIHPDQSIRMKFEADVLPPSGAAYELKYSLLPAPYKVRLYDLPSLFAGKIHAVLCRGWKNRVKGRDLYDYLFYLSRSVPVNMKNLNEKLRESGFTDHDLPLEELRQKLNDRFRQIDYSEAIRDVEPFIKSSSRPSLDLWSSDFFIQMTESLQEKL